jgi:glutamate---cysteine ligase / carboxylate-amine ligase
MTRAPLHLFEGFGLELEYMIVDAQTLAVRPLADRLLAAAALEEGAKVETEPGEPVDDLAFGNWGWSNELALHIVEFKTAGPVPDLSGAAAGFAAQVALAERLLEPLGARLLPTAMHPWMNPETETRLWPHGSREIYAAYNRIFDCRGHGWSNLQSAHLNLGFAGDGEFARLHAAVRIVLPLIPALAASSPFVEGRATGWLDTRLDVYRRNQRAVPQIAGAVIPEPAWSRADYHRMILEPAWAAIAPHDPDGLLQQEWLNSRGAIARYDRSALEIRLVDLQECPRADTAVAAAIVHAIRRLERGDFASLGEQQAQPTEALAAVLWACAREGERALVRDPGLLGVFGLHAGVEAGELWRLLLSDRRGLDSEHAAPIDELLGDGPLARRLLKAAGPEPPRERLREIYGELGECLREGRVFKP